MRYYKTKNGYYFKETNNGNKTRISQLQFIQNGGYNNNNNNFDYTTLSPKHQEIYKKILQKEKNKLKNKFYQN